MSDNIAAASPDDELAQDTANASIFLDTLAEMTAPEIDAAIKRGAILLWGTGVIEQHGPHLPTGTDVYVPSARLRIVRKLLAREGIEALIVPPFYWGVNFVSASFPGTIKVRAEIMVELMVDVMKSFAGDGARRLFCVSGHNDRAHNEAIVQAMRKGSAESGLQACFITEDVIVQRLGMSLDDPAVLPFPSVMQSKPGAFLDIHAGCWETSVMLGYNPEVVREGQLPGLAPTKLGPADLAEWRKGCEHTQRVTPLGYFGDPASSSAEYGRYTMLKEAQAITKALKARLGTSPASAA
jgi:creatinine amidohydrolase